MLTPLVLVALLVTTLAGALSANWREVLRRYAIVQLRYDLQRNVTLDAVDVDLRGRASLIGLTVFSRESPGARLFSASTVDIHFRPWRFFALPFRPVSSLQRIVLERPYLDLTRDPGGRVNVQDIVERHHNTRNVDRFRGGITVHDGELRYRDTGGIAGRSGPLEEHLTHLEASLAASPDGAMPFQASATSQLGHVQQIAVAGSMHFARQRLLCDIRYGQVDLGFVQRFLPKSMPLQMQSGTADGRWEVALYLDTPQPRLQTTFLADVAEMRGTWTVKGGRTVPCHVAGGQVRMADDALELVDVQGDVNGAPLVVNGHISRLKTPVYDIEVKTPGAPTNRVIALLPGLDKLDYSWGGLLRGWVQLSGTAEALHVTGEIPPVAPSAFGVPLGPTVTTEFGTFSGLSGKIDAEDGALRLSAMQGYGYGAALKGEAWIALPGARQHDAAILFDGEVLGDGVTTGADARLLATQFLERGDAGRNIRAQLLGTGPDARQRDLLQGRLVGKLTIKSGQDQHVTVMLPRCQGQVQLAGRWGGVVDASLQFDAWQKTAETTIERLTLATPEGTLQMRGGISRQGDMKLAVRGGRLDLAALSGLLQRQDLTGTGYLMGQLAGTGGDLRFAGALQACDGALAGLPFREIRSDLLVAGGAEPLVGLRGLRILSTAGQLNADAELRRSPAGVWSARGRLQLPCTSLRALSALAGVALPIAGYAEGDVLFADVPGKPQGQARIVLRRPRVQLGNATVEFDRAMVDFSLGETALEIAEGQLVYQGTPLVVRGRMRTDRTDDPASRLALQVQVPGVSADTLLALARDLRGGAARPNLPLDIEGDFAINATVTAGARDGHEPLTIDPATVVVRGDITRRRQLEIAGVPFRGFAAEGSYRAADGRLALDTFTLNREGRTAGGGYALVLSAPSALDLARAAVDLHIAFPEARLEEVRRDLLAMEKNTRVLAQIVAESPVALTGSDSRVVEMLAPISNAVAAVPASFAGTGRAQLDLAGPLRAPRGQFRFSLADMVLAKHSLPDVDGALAFDAATRLLRIERLQAHGAPAQGGEMPLTAELEGTVVLPARVAGSAFGPGVLDLSVNAQNVDPQQLGTWLSNPAIARFGGRATVVAKISNTTEHPTVVASLDVTRPSLSGLQFDALSAVVTLDHDRLWIGNRYLGPQLGAATLELKGTADGPRKPLEVYGYLPLRLDGFTPRIPQDEEMDIALTLPAQGTDFLRAYLPDLPPGAGTMSASLQLRGTMARPIVPQGALRLDVPEMALDAEDADLPNRLRQVALDVAVSSRPTGEGFTNVLELRDLSAVYDRVETRAPKREPKAISWLRARLGLKNRTRKPFAPGAIVAQGTVKLVTMEGAPIPLGDLVNPLVSVDRRAELLAGVFRQLRYDLYAKTVRTPVRWRDIFQGDVTAYLHLGNRLDAGGHPVRPLITGVLYAEGATATYTGVTGLPPERPTLAFDPELSVAVQVGPGNRFIIGPDNVLFSNALSGNFPFRPTDLFSPVSEADMAILATGKAAKPPVEPEHPAYAYTADSLKPYAGTRGAITGTLSQPTLMADYSLPPRKAQAIFPRGRLTIDQGEGTLHYTLGQPMYLYAKAQGSGLLDGYRIAATIDGNLLQALADQAAGTPESALMDPLARRLPVTFTTVSSPKGAPPLNDAQIYTRLVGITDLVAVLEGKQSMWQPLTTIGRDMFFRTSFDKFAERMGLETFSVNFATERYPELTLTTPEYGGPKTGTLRFGTTREIATNPQWSLWVDLRLPQYRWLRDLSITAETDNAHENTLSLSWRRQF